MRRLLALLIALVFALAASGSAFAQEDGADDLFGDDELFSDEFGGAEEEETDKRGLRFWAFDVPVDVLVLRPVAFVDTAVGMMFFTGISPFQVVGAFFGSAWGWLGDGEWYVDQAGMDQAWQQLVTDPFEYMTERPLGVLTSD